jgi:hypothetical protein
MRAGRTGVIGARGCPGTTHTAAETLTGGVDTTATSLAQEPPGMLKGAQVLEADALQDLERRSPRRRAAPDQGRPGASPSLSLAWDDATTQATATRLRQNHRQAVQRRATVAALSQETAAATSPVTTAQEVAPEARRRLLKADRAPQDEVARPALTWGPRSRDRSTRRRSLWRAQRPTGCPWQGVPGELATPRLSHGPSPALLPELDRQVDGGDAGQDLHP